MNNKMIGRWGEALAADYLKRNGYKITGMNFSTRFGEIDIIAEDRKNIAFVEVKLRKNRDFAEAREFVDRRKQAKIITAAKIWLSYHDTGLQPRFDVIEIYAPTGVDTVKPVINHIPEAFDASS